MINAIVVNFNIVLTILYGMKPSVNANVNKLKIVNSHMYGMTMNVSVYAKSKNAPMEANLI